MLYNMTYEINYERTATRAIRRLDAQDRIRIVATIATLADDPRPTGAATLTGPLAGHRRIRVGAHLRVLYKINEKAKTVTIVNAGTRENFY